MYFILILLHGIFIGIVHFLGYYILEGIFILLLLFFLLYFSPIFFSKKDTNFPTFSLSKISFSLENSLLLPMVFFYIAGFFLLFAVTGDFFTSFHYNILFFILVYCVFFLYILAFDWNNDIFFDIAKIHLIATYAILFSVVFVSFFSVSVVNLSTIVLLLVSIAFSLFYFRHNISPDILFFQGFLWMVMFSPFLLSVLTLSSVSYSFLLFSFGIIAIILFEGMPRFSFFDSFLPISKVYVLIGFMVSYIASIIGSFFDAGFYPFLLIGIAFLFLIHIRFSNYIALFSALFGIFFLYSLVFSSLMTSTSLLSTLLFIFFLPLCII